MVVNGSSIRVHWAAFRVLQARVTVVAYTARGEPIVRAGSDRLVLRAGSGTFWVSATCPTCGAEMADEDLGSHACDGRNAVTGAAPSSPRQDEVPGVAPEAGLDHTPTKARRRHAQTVAQETLGQRVAIVGLDSGNALIVTVGNVRLMLPEGAHHFRLMGLCAFCGGETRSRILTPDDLMDETPRICRRCVQGEPGATDASRVGHRG